MVGENEKKREESVFNSCESFSLHLFVTNNSPALTSLNMNFYNFMLLRQKHTVNTHTFTHMSNFLSICAIFLFE